MSSLQTASDGLAWEMGVGIDAMIEKIGKMQE